MFDPKPKPRRKMKLRTRIARWLVAEDPDPRYSLLDQRDGRTMNDERTDKP